MAPEYASSGKLTARSDVFSFGVVLLVLVTGQKPVDVSQPLGDESLVEWVCNVVQYFRLLQDLDDLYHVYFIKYLIYDSAYLHRGTKTCDGLGNQDENCYWINSWNSIST